MDLQTRSHLPELRERLLRRHSELQYEVRAASEALHDQERGADVRDSKDEADLRQRVTGEDLQLARDLAELQDVEDALGRLAAGSYGDCAGCGAAIPAARLAVQPAARLCTACQSQLETRR
ncbi:MAG TPA: TraR/DksA family transcriptional regulator [Roseateles sp.]